jgi:hypothetical protein
MDRRVTLQKHREVSEVFVPASGGCSSPPATSPPFITGGPSLLLGSSGTSIIECDTETITVPLETIDSSIRNITVSNNSESTPITDNQNIVSPRSSWEIAKRRRRGDPENTSSTSCSGGRRKRLTSWTSSINSDVLSHDGRNSVTKETTGEHKRMQRKLRTKGFISFFVFFYFKCVNEVNVELKNVNYVVYTSPQSVSFCVVLCV